MSTVICNAPSCLIPKELFQEEKIQEYWNVLYATQLHHESIGKDELENFFLLYPNPKNVDAIHEISFMFKELREKFPNQPHAVCINVHDTGFNLLALKEQHIAYTGYFHYAVKEDILYHITNIFQHFFDDNTQVAFFYQQLSPAILRLLSNYYEMKKL